MHFLTPMCCVCLSTTNLININEERLYKLLCFTDKTSDLEYYTAYYTRICYICSVKLDVLFDFKQMFAKSASLFKTYFHQLTSVSNIASPNKLKKLKLILTDYKCCNGRDSNDDRLQSVIEESADQDLGAECVVKNENLRSNEDFWMIEDDDQLLEEEINNFEAIPLETNFANVYLSDENLADHDYVPSTGVKQSSKFNSENNFEDVFIGNNFTGDTFLNELSVIKDKFADEYLNQNSKPNFEATLQPGKIQCSKSTDFLREDQQELFSANFTDQHAREDKLNFEVTSQLEEIQPETIFLKQEVLDNLELEDEAKSETHVTQNSNLTPEYKTNKRRGFKNHRKTSGSFICPTCSKRFRFKKYLTEHVKAHGQTQIHCPICGIDFPSNRKLSNHVLIHANTYACYICGKSFTTSDMLKAHVELHSDDCPYVCNKCLKRFSTITFLKSHMFSHTTERPHKCSTCGKCFKTKSNLKAHQVIHTTKCSNSCTTCKENDCKLQTTAESHVCPTCDRRFKNNCELKAHEIMSHNTKVRYTCPRCNAEFYTKDNLKIHLKTHANK